MMEPWEMGLRMAETIPKTTSTQNDLLISPNRIYPRSQIHASCTNGGASSGICSTLNVGKEMAATLSNTSRTHRSVMPPSLTVRHNKLTLPLKTQSRMRQEQQQAMLRGLRTGDVMGQQYQQMMMRGQANGMNLNPNEHLRQKAIQNQQRA